MSDDSYRSASCWLQDLCVCIVCHVLSLFLLLAWQICSLLRGGIAERGGVRVGHRIIEINGQSVVAVPHERIVGLLATSVGEVYRDISINQCHAQEISTWFLSSYLFLLLFFLRLPHYLSFILSLPSALGSFSFSSRLIWRPCPPPCFAFWLARKLLSTFDLILQSRLQTSKHKKNNTQKKKRDKTLCFRVRF